MAVDKTLFVHGSTLLHGSTNLRPHGGTDYHGYVGLHGYVSGGGDVTAPTLSSPVDNANGQTGANISVSTNEGNGTLYWYISLSSSPPSAANLKSGAGAVVAGNQVVNATGVQNASPTGLTAATTYYAHFLHSDAAGNDSAIVSGNGFTTDAVSSPQAIVFPDFQWGVPVTGQTGAATNWANGGPYEVANPPIGVTFTVASQVYTLTGTPV